MKKTRLHFPALFLACSLVFSFSACTSYVNSSSSSSPASSLAATEAITITDSLGQAVTIPKNPRVVSLYGSYTEAWLLAGGDIVGTTEDAVNGRDLGLPADVKILGTVKDPGSEEIIACSPDIAICSADISSQADLRDTLENAGIPCAYFRVDSFSDYNSMMREFCKITGREDLYTKNVQEVGTKIEEIKKKSAQSTEAPKVLLLRAFSSGLKAKAEDELAGIILKDLGCENIAENSPAMSEDLSMEEVISSDPDFLFVTTMGDEKKALAYLDSLTSENPAWSELRAVKKGHYTVLPKELFHYKPNNRWGESYEFLAKILYPELF